MTQGFAYVFVVIIGYLFGSIPAGYLAGKIRGIDIRTVGSGNIGTTNTFRVLGKKAGIAVLIVDTIKGFIPAFWLPHFGLLIVRDTTSTSGALSFHFAMLAGLASILGHVYPCWLRFRGGKGIATTGGVYAALAPIPVALTLALWLIIFISSGYVSLASIAAAVGLPFFVWFMGCHPILVGLTIVIGLLALYKHRSNAQRLLNGTEHRFNLFRRKKESS